MVGVVGSNPIAPTKELEVKKEKAAFIAAFSFDFH